MTCVIVTHNMQQAAPIADRAMHLEAGELVTIGAVREALHAS
jgi:putative ABC transport system ATP-binding protein